MQVQIEKYTSIGMKEKNEDYLDFVIGEDYFIATLADGIGSHGRGDEASKIAVDVLNKLIKKNIKKNLNKENITKIFNVANEEIIKKQNKSSEMKTTACLVFYKNDLLTLSHIGDSRIYYFSDSKIKYLSRDHSVSRLQFDIGEIEFSQIRGHIDRNRITRALGASDDQVNPVVEEFENIKKGDAILICTDGYWEDVLEEEMLETLKESKDCKTWLEKMTTIVEKRSKGNEKKDNNSAICIRFL